MLSSVLLLMLPLLFCFFFYWYTDNRDLHSFPTRRSSDLCSFEIPRIAGVHRFCVSPALHSGAGSDVSLYLSLDRKSTRLNSSHRTISYAVFCLKKKIKV